MISSLASIYYGLDYQNLQSAFDRISTGKQINSAADNPAGYAIATALASQAAGFNAASGNITNAQNALNVAAGALASDNAAISQLDSLSITGANDFLSPTDRAALQAQASQLAQQVNTVAQSANFNGRPLLNGGFAGAIQSGANEGNVTNVSIPSGAASAIGLNVPNLGSTAAAQNTELSGNTAQQNLLATEATLGAQQVSLGYDQQAADIAANALTASSSSIADANPGQQSTLAAASQLLSQIALYVKQQMNGLALQTGQLIDLTA
jgi:flagellin